MTLTGHNDGDDASTGASYLEIADHLRDHGFLLVPDKGWRLSRAYDMNAVPGSSGLSLNIDESDNALDLALVRSVAPYFRIKDAAAKEIINRMTTVIGEWGALASSFGIKRSEVNDMADAFLICE